MDKSDKSDKETIASCRYRIMSRLVSKPHNLKKNSSKTAYA